MAPTSRTPVVVPFGLADWLMSSESSDEVTAQFCAHFLDAMCTRKLAQTKHCLLISSSLMLLANLKGIERKKSA